MSGFCFRGALSAESPLFHGRQAELEELCQLTRPPWDTYGLVIGGAMAGKTSLLNRLQARVSPEHASAVCTLSGAKDEVYRYLAEELARYCPGAPAKTVREEVRDGPRFRGFLRQLDPQRPLVVMLDQLDHVPKDVIQGLLDNLASIHQERLSRENEVFGRFLFIVTGGIEIIGPSSESHVSPFLHVATQVFLGDLSREESDRLLSYGLAPSGFDPEKLAAVCPLIYEQAGGHPFLTQRMGAAVAEIPGAASESPDVLVERAAQILLDKEAAHFRSIRNALQTRKLMPALQHAVMLRETFDRADGDIAALEALGVLRREGGICVIRNRLYARALRLSEISQFKSRTRRQTVQPSLTFRLQLTSAVKPRDLDDSQFAVRVLESPFWVGPEVPTHLPYTADQLVALYKALPYESLSRSTEVLRTSKLTEAQLLALENLGLIVDSEMIGRPLEKVGVALSEALLPGDVWTTLARTLDQAEREDKIVRLQLCFDAHDVLLARFPWELLYQDEIPLLVVSGSGVEMARYITYHQPPRRKRPEPPLRLLYVRSYPTNLGGAPAKETEKQAVHDELRALRDQRLLEIEELLPATYDNLRERLETPPDVHVIHFEGHGTMARFCPHCDQYNYPHHTTCQGCKHDLREEKPRGYLLFEKPGGDEADWVPSDTLATILGSRVLRLIVLSACRSGEVRGETLFGGVGPALIRAGVPAVVAMQAPITVESAAAFMKGFYRALAQTKTLPAAMSVGRRALAREREWFVPILYLRNQDIDGRFF